MARAPRDRSRARFGGGAGLPFVPGVSLVSLSNASIAENAAQGAVVGALSVVPSVAALSLVDSAGGRFAISGGDLVRGATALDFEAASTHTVVVRASRGLVVNDVELTITVTNVAEITNIALTPATLVEGSTEDDIVGTLTSTPAGATFALLDDAGGRVKLQGMNIVAGATPTVFADADSHDITVRGTRQSETFDKVITIAVTEAP